MPDRPRKLYFIRNAPVSPEKISVMARKAHPANKENLSDLGDISDNCL